MKDIDKKLLKKWMNDELKGAELESFEKSDTYKKYHKIIDITNDLETPLYNEEQVYTRIKQGIKDNPKLYNTGATRLNIRYISGIAATLLILVGIYFFMNDSIFSAKTGYGETYTLQLPDGSEVTLNANSSVSYDQKNFLEKRKVELEGEAYFDVEKGSGFVVETKEGSVTVLGTKFNVDTGLEFLEVQCYSGKVKVDGVNKMTAILTRGKSVRMISESLEKTELDSSNPSWLQGISSFENTPFWKVINALENQFELKFKNVKPYASERFTGSFSNSDKNNAVQTVLSAMGLNYTVNGNKINIE